MFAPVKKTKKNTSPTSRAVANSVSQKKNNVKQVVGFADNRSEFIKQRKLIGIANNGQDVKQATQLPLMDDTYSARQLTFFGGDAGKRLGKVMQREVHVNGARVSSAELRAQGWAEYLVRMVSVWDSSNLLHQFPDLQALLGWLNVAKQRLIGDVPDLYTLQYFRFTTEEGGRAPSLYFIKSQNEHGRIRQQHAQGPVIDELGGTKEDFFYNQSQDIEDLLNSKYDDAAEAFRVMGSVEAAKFKMQLRNLGASEQPSDGTSHMEIKPAGGSIDWIHESGGTVRLPNNHPEYDDMMIRKIYLDTTGRFD